MIQLDWGGPSYPSYDGLMKGGDVAKQQMQLDNQLKQQAFNAQQAQLGQVNAAASPYINGTIGYDPALLADLTSQFLNNNSQTYNQAGSNVRAALAARGAPGMAPASGADARGFLGLESAKAQSQSQGLLGLGVSNLQQALTNRFNAMSVMSGNAATLNSPIATFQSGASNALNQYMQAANSGFGASFMRGLGGSLGGGIGGGLTGGIGGAFAGMGGGFLSNFGTGMQSAGRG